MISHTRSHLYNNVALECFNRILCNVDPYSLISLLRTVNKIPPFL